MRPHRSVAAALLMPLACAPAPTVEAATRSFEIATKVETKKEDGPVQEAPAVCEHDAHCRIRRDLAKCEDIAVLALEPEAEQPRTKTCGVMRSSPEHVAVCDHERRRCAIRHREGAPPLDDFRLQLACRRAGKASHRRTVEILGQEKIVRIREDGRADREGTFDDEERARLGSLLASPAFAEALGVQPRGEARGWDCSLRFASPTVSANVEDVLGPELPFDTRVVIIDFLEEVRRLERRVPT